MGAKSCQNDAREGPDVATKLSEFTDPGGRAVQEHNRGVRMIAENPTPGSARTQGKDDPR
jgi:hypothetical protein